MKFKRVTGLVLAAALTVSLAAFPPAPGSGKALAAAASSKTTQQKIDELSAKQKKLEDDLAKIRGNINSYKSQAGKQAEYIDSIQDELQKQQDQINLLGDQISLLNSRISEIDAQIAKVNSELDKISADITETENTIARQTDEMNTLYESFKQRVKAMYIAGEMSDLQILLSSSDFSELLTRSELIKSVAKHDSKLIEDLNKKIDSVKSSRDQLQAQKKEQQAKFAELDSEKKDLKSQKASLDAAKNSKEAKVSELSAAQDSAEKEKQRLEAEVKAASKSAIATEDILQETEEQIDALIKQKQQEYASTIAEFKPSGAALEWPVPGYTHISSPFGMRTMNGVTKMHYGIDIATGSGQKSIAGANIVAAEAGVVLYVKWDPDGYGNYLAIDHGGGIVTLYAHCNSISAHEGQKVARGDVIAKVGTTGNSTGYHLHFEVRVDGTKMNPVNYL